MKNNSKNKAFTLIELIVVMAIIGILVLLSMPKLMGHTKNAKFTKFIANTKNLETASERYYIDKESWPRLSDIPYTADEIEAFAQKIYDSTGKTIELDPDGNYYDINYDELSKYIRVPDDKANYIIQNPVGSIYALDGLTETAKVRISDNQNTPVPTPQPINNKPVAVITMTPSNNINISTNINWSYTNSTDGDSDSVVAFEWQLDDGPITTSPNGIVPTVGLHIMKLRVQDSKGNWSDWTNKLFNVTNKSLGMALTTPEFSWQRINDTDSSITYLTRYRQYNDSSTYKSTEKVWDGSYNIKDTASIQFKFKGTKLRLIAYRGPDRATNCKVIIDSVTYTMNQNGTYQHQTLLFHIDNLEDKVHEVTIVTGTTGSYANLLFDAIDIDETGYMVTD